MIPGSNYKYDLFISYAHADNVPFPGTDAKLGWVTIFADTLKNILSRKLQRDASIWMDHRELRGNAPLTPAIMDALRQTATIVVVASTRYLASEWCQRERESFLQFISERSASGSRVFRVEIDKIEKIPADFRDTIGYSFWVETFEDPTPQTLGFPVPDPSRDKEYYRRLFRIGNELAEAIKILGEPSTGHDTTTESPLRPCVFLAEVTDDLDSKREEVRDYLSQAGIKVLPGSWRAYQDLPAYERALDADLSRCQLFVQLLSELAGKKPFNQLRTYPQLQYERALSAGKTILQWRSEKTKPGTVSDSQHQALLEGNSVRAESLEEFKRAVVAAATPPPPAPPPLDGKFVFISADIPDRRVAEAYIGPPLTKRGISYAMAPTASDPESVRRFVEVSLANCDAALVVYCAADQASVLGQVLQCRKVIAQRDQPVPAIAIYNGPPPPDQRGELTFRFPNLHLLDCRHDQAALERFLDGLA